MNERPILFSAPMVHAILNGHKTQTRRVVKPQREVKWFPDAENWNVKDAGWFAHVEENDTSHDREWQRVKCPYGKIGDRLWVRETFRNHMPGGCDTMPELIEHQATPWPDAQNHLKIEKTWSPPIFMPRWASRISLEIVNIRAERVQKISSTDALAEGVDAYYLGEQQGSFPDPAGAFSDLWDSINGKKSGYDWEANPWVWVLEFRKLAAVTA